MKSIFNWTVGSFFRTIGRIIAFLAVGALIASLVDFGDIMSNFKITDLFFDKVDALEGEAQYHNLFFDNARLPYVGASPVYHYFELYNSTSTTLLNTKQLQWGDSTPSSTNMMGGYDFVEFSFIVLGTMQPNVGQTAGVIDFDNSEYCTEWTPKTGGGYTCVRVTQGENFQNTLMDYEFRNIVLNMKASVINAANLATECEVDLAKQKITCPLWAVNRVGFNQIRLQYSMNGRGSAGVYLAISRTIFLYNDSSSVISGQINQQTQQQQQQHNETQSYLEDSNTTQAESEASDFFEDFEQEDFGGLSAIITAPLNTIRSLLNSNCTNLVLPLPFVNENLTLPCMNSIYTTHFGAFFAIYQTIILAIIAYRCIRSIYYDIHGFTNPNDDRIEVMDL